MQYKIQLNASGKKREESGNLSLKEILALGDKMIENAIKESE